MSESPARLKRAAVSKRRSDENYGAALLAARAAGHSFAEIAKAAGTSRQRVRQWLERQASLDHGNNDDGEVLLRAAL